MRLNHKKNTLYYEELQKFDLVKLFFCENTCTYSQKEQKYMYSNQIHD